MAQKSNAGMAAQRDATPRPLGNLLPAGAETTWRSTASLALALLAHPDQLDAVREYRGLLPQAIQQGIAGTLHRRHHVPIPAASGPGVGLRTVLP